MEKLNINFYQSKSIAEINYFIEKNNILREDIVNIQIDKYKKITLFYIDKRR